MCARNVEQGYRTLHYVRQGRGVARTRGEKLLILRFAPQGLRRLRLETTRSSRISLRTAS